MTPRGPQELRSREFLTVHRAEEGILPAETRKFSTPTVQTEH